MLSKQQLNSIFQIQGYIQKPEALFLYSLARNVNKNGVIVELGSFKGRSTVCLGLACKNKGITVYAVDTFKGDSSTGIQNTYKAFRQAVRTFKLTRSITAKKGTTIATAKKWKKPIDMLFIDALHTYKAVKNDFLYWEPFVKKNGIIAFHDTLLKNPPRKVFEKIVLPDHRFEIIGYSESTIAVKKVKRLTVYKIFKNYVLYYIRDIKKHVYEYFWPVRKVSAMIGIYNEKEY